MINRGYVYWDEFICSNGAKKRVPVLVLSNDDNNRNSAFVNTVRLAIGSEPFHPSNIVVPADAWVYSSQIGQCIIRCETISATKVCDLYGPIAQIKDYWMSRVEDAVKKHLGMAPFTADIYWTPGYSAPHSPQARQTYPQTPVTPRPYERFSVDYTHRDTQTVPRATQDAFNDSITKMYGQPETEEKP